MWAVILSDLQSKVIRLYYTSYILVRDDYAGIILSLSEHWELCWHFGGVN